MDCERFCDRYANCVPPLMEALEMAEVEHNARNNRMRALWSIPPPSQTH